MNMPSFQPWYARVRMVRLWLAIITFIVVAAIARGQGFQWDESLMSAVAGAVVAFFIGWAASLWIFAELYQVQVRRAEDELREREERRREQLRELTESRSNAIAAGDYIPGIDDQPIPGDEDVGRAA